MRIQRKAYIREERRSIRKQKNQLRTLRWNRRMGLLSEMFKHLKYNVFDSVSGEKNSEFKKDLAITVLNSTMFYFIAFWLIYLMGQLLTVLAANYFSIPVIVYSYKTLWPLYDYSPLYTRFNLVLIFGVGPAACFMVAILLLRLLHWKALHYSTITVFLIWIIFHGLNNFFGAYLAGVITRTGFVFSASWLFKSLPFDPEGILMLCISVIALVIVGFVLGRKYMLGALSMKFLQEPHRRHFIYAEIIVPWILGTGLILLVNVPGYSNEFILLLGFSFLIILPAFSLKPALSVFMEEITIPEDKLKTNWIGFVVFIVVLLIVRLLVYPGLHFE